MICHRYGRVTLEEHQAVQADLASARAELAAVAPRLAGCAAAEAAAAEARRELDAAKAALEEKVRWLRRVQPHHNWPH
jgi:Lon protease-like protein